MSTPVTVSELEEICRLIWQTRLTERGTRHALESLASLATTLTSWGINSLPVEW
ncbi:hypothetical protein [Leptolyngbya sp. FACHB-261]|uniref:hypothetical protein n=1 Tax=Leptolyngbya sp. FACHB-261 TaxID=2692806 RepID=UPI001686D160|nr:hypothetical protein [Leptolyngbya sp. FACHB-261]MBD2105075.1 hypothetical protein [Leptolyngbya sp. FACHB-261]